MLFGHWENVNAKSLIPIAKSREAFEAVYTLLGPVCPSVGAGTGKLSRDNNDRKNKTFSRPGFRQ